MILHGSLKGNLFYLLPVLKICYSCWPTWQDGKWVAKLDAGPHGALWSTAGHVHEFMYCFHIRIQTVYKGSGTICVDCCKHTQGKLDAILRQGCYVLLQCILSVSKAFFFWSLWIAGWSRGLQGEGFVKEMPESCLCVYVYIYVCVCLYICAWKNIVYWNINIGEISWPKPHKYILDIKEWVSEVLLTSILFWIWHGPSECVCIMVYWVCDFFFFCTLFQVSYMHSNSHYLHFW